MVFGVGLKKLYREKQKRKLGKIFGDTQKKLGQQAKNPPPHKKIKTTHQKPLYQEKKILRGGCKKIGEAKKLAGRG